MATLGEVMSRDVITIEPFDTIGHAAEKMVAEGVSAIVVSDGGRLIGIVTERDLTRAVAGRVHSREGRGREMDDGRPEGGLRVDGPGRSGSDHARRGIPPP